MEMLFNFPNMMTVIQSLTLCIGLQQDLGWVVDHRVQQLLQPTDLQTTQPSHILQQQPLRNQTQMAAVDRIARLQMPAMTREVTPMEDSAVMLATFRTAESAGLISTPLVRTLSVMETKK